MLFSRRGFCFLNAQDLLKCFFLYSCHAWPAFRKHSLQKEFFHADMKTFLLQNSDKGAPENN